MNRSRLWTLVLGTFCLALPADARAADPEPRKPAGELLDAQALAARIDRHINARLAERDVKPAPVADDAEFMRRVYLDLAGRIPRVAEARAFLDDKSPGKRARLVERLLASPQYVSHFGNTWTAIILPQNNNQFRLNIAATFRPWIEKQVRENTPYDQMVRELLTAGTANLGVTIRAPGVVPRQTVPTPQAFYQANELKPENLAASTSRVFLGVRLECAQCHDHPFTSWKRQQFWELAAFFAGVQRPTRVAPGRAPQPAANQNAHSIKIPGTEKVVQARFLDGAAPNLPPQVNPRTALADWVTAEGNPYFARTGANRVWGHFFGIGLIDPIDDEPTEDNPASHAELLADLTRQFVAHQYDVKYLIRAITASQAYQRTSAVSGPAQNEPRLFARMSLRGMTPEQLFDSLAQATGYREPRVSGPVPLRLNQQSPRGQFLAKFASQERKTETQTSILQALSLMNGKFIADATSLERSTTLAAVADAPFLSMARRIETLYLAALSRRPRAEEMARMVTYIEGGGPRGSQDSALADVFWVLLNSSEFILNH
jgi:hypothetical protein